MMNIKPGNMDRIIASEKRRYNRAKALGYLNAFAHAVLAGSILPAFMISAELFRTW